MTPEAQRIKKNKQIELHKNLKTCTANDTIEKVKRLHTMGKNTYKNLMRQLYPHCIKNSCNPLNFTVFN